LLILFKFNFVKNIYYIIIGTELTTAEMKIKLYRNIFLNQKTKEM